MRRKYARNSAKVMHIFATTLVSLKSDFAEIWHSTQLMVNYLHNAVPSFVAIGRNNVYVRTAIWTDFVITSRRSDGLATAMNDGADRQHA